MNKRIDYWINETDKAGDELIESILKPIAKGTFDFLVKDNRIAQSFLSLKTAFMGSKISSFLNYIYDTTENETISFIDKLNNEEKKFFIESINKVIDLDDELQIFIMSMLLKSYKIKGNLDYFEKSLYYNINQISKDDFSIYYCFYSKYVLNNEKINSFDIEYSIENKDIVEIVFKKFISFGIIQDNTSVKIGGSSKMSFRFSLSSYSNILYENLNYFFKDQNIDDLYQIYLPIDLDKNKAYKVKITGH